MNIRLRFPIALLLALSASILGHYTPLYAHAAGTNLINNPKFEAASPSNAALPDGWLRGRWGTNTATFSYPSVGPDQSRAVQIVLSDYVSGDAKWYFPSVPVTPGTTYEYSDDYAADVPTYVTLQYTMADGTLKYPDIAHPNAQASWTAEKIRFTPPAGATAVTVFHLINQAGSLKIDNTSLVEVSNPPPGNLIKNPSLEDSGAQGLPLNWKQGKWGTQTTLFTYPTAGEDGAKAARVAITSYASGDAKWYFDSVPAQPGEVFQFSDYSKASIPSTITVEFKKSDGTFSYADIGTMAPHASWTPFTAHFTAPAGAVSLTVFHLIGSVGYLETDNASLSTLASDPDKFDKGYVSLDFDDGILSTYQNAMPILTRAGFVSTQYIITNYVKQGFPGYVSQAQILDMQSHGHVIGAHTRTHPDLTATSSQAAWNEINGSRQDLIAMGAVPVNYFAYPLGAFNEQVQQQVQDAGYKAARSTQNGFNDKTTDPYALKRVSMDTSTTFASAKEAIDTALAQKSWVILLFHHVDYGSDPYTVSPELFQQIVDYLKQKNVAPITVDQGVQKMRQ